MQTISKVLVVFITAASLAFFGFSWALATGGPNWQALANAPELSKDIEIKPPAPGVKNSPWTGTDRRTAQSIKSSPNLADVVVAGQKKVLDDLRARSQTLQQELEAIKPQLDGFKQVNAADHQGIELRFTDWSQKLQQLAKALQAISVQLEGRSTEVTAAQRDLEERRFEVYRMQAQLELLRDDLFAADTQREALADELLDLEETQRRLERRQAQLKTQVDSGKYEQ